jgi:hypothetical protein
MEIFIPHNVASSKNSKEIISLPIKGQSRCKCCGNMKRRPMLTDSKTTKAYKKATEGYYLANKVAFKNLIKDLEPPYKISFRFVRGSKHKFDYINAAQVVQDLMVKHGWLEDDNCTFLIPSFEPFEYDKENAGVYISLKK